MLKLEVGKTYLNRQGDVVEIVRSVYNRGSVEFVDADRNTYTMNGEVYQNETSKYDLLLECFDPVDPAPIQESDKQESVPVVKFKNMTVEIGKCRVGTVVGYTHNVNTTGFGHIVAFCRNAREEVIFDVLLENGKPTLIHPSNMDIYL